MTTRYGKNYHSITVECYATGIANLAGLAIGNPIAAYSQRALDLLEENYEQLSEFAEAWNWNNDPR